MNRIPTLITLAALTLPITNLYAQDNPDRQRPDRPDRAQRREPGQGGLAALKSALAALTLSDDQKSKSEEILKSAGERLDKARQEMAAAQGGDRRQAAQQFAQVARATTEEITALLDEDQKALFNQKLQESRQRQGPRDGERGPGPRDGERGGPNPPSFARNLEQASARLELTDEQKQKVQALASDVATKTQALHEEALKQLKTILSEEQFQQFQQMQPGPGGPPLAGGEPAGRGGPGALLQRLRTALSQLELTDDQKAKAKPAMESFEKKMQELRASAQGTRPGPELREKFRQHTQELRAELQAILTPEQLEKVRGVLQGGEGRRPGRPGAPGQRPNRPRRPNQQ